MCMAREKQDNRLRGTEPQPDSDATTGYEAELWAMAEKQLAVHA